jgi:xanthine dehydrogenase YagS FAD-binding subunit
MRAFSYARAATLSDAIGAAAQADTMLIAGGTELLNWMKESIVAPRRIIDLSGVAGLDQIVVDEQGLKIGALARMSDVAAHQGVQREYPVLSQSLLQSASAQIRNMASMGGNVMQRTRCPYFRAEVELPCNKRQPGSGCSAIHGEDRSAAIFGGSEHCVATHPSDAAVALAALDAVIHVEGPAGQRMIPFAQFHRLPDDTPHRETELARGEIITAIDVPASAAARRSHYLKVRERTSYEFALVSAAVAIDLDGHSIRKARIALGGVAPKPWLLSASERALRGVALSDTSALRGALGTDFTEARSGRHNGFKIELAKRTVIRALQTAGGMA